MAKYKIGDNVGELRITGCSVKHDGKRNRRYYDYACNCGSLGEARQDHIDSGQASSCGSCRERRLKGVPKWMVSVLQQARAGIIDRCYNKGCEKYKWYGAKGVELRGVIGFGVVEFVLGVYESIGDRPDGYSIDRIDTDGHYEIGNLRWASDIEQNRNHGS